MPVRLIAHRIEKKQHSKETNSLLRAELLPSSDDLASKFMDALRTAVNHRNPVAARFERVAHAKPAFEQRLTAYLKKTGDADFIAFSRDATTLLERRMKTEPLATGGYVVFAEYSQDKDTFLLVAVLSTKAEPSFDEDLNLISAVTLDFEHLRYAGRVRFGGVEHNEDGVVHFVSRRMEGLSDYFREFLGCEPVTDSSAQGRNLFTALSKFAEGEELSSDAKEAMMQQTYSYWQECRKADRPMTITGIANSLRPDDPTKILKHLTHESWGLAGEFAPPPTGVMKQFKKFTFARAGLKLEFDRNEWLGNITVKERSVTIRNAPEELIEKLKEEKNV